MPPTPTSGLAPLLLILAAAVAVGQEQPAERDRPEGAVLQQIRQLEGRSDPKCHATAARLEDFMYGTPLTEDARILKNRLVKRFVESVWRRAGADGRKAVELAGIEAALQEQVWWKTQREGTGVSFRGGRRVTVAARDLRHYASVAYSLRAILATQQEGLFKSPALARLSEEAAGRLREASDLVALSLLQEADRRARAASRRAVSEEEIGGAWEELLGKRPADGEEAVTVAPVVNGQPLLRRIAAQKIASYAEYNQIANQLFVRNLQVYFARLSWPADPAEGTAFRQLFTETVIAFAADLYRHAGVATVRNKKVVIGEGEVVASGRAFLPHRVNEYEDVIFFPRLARAERVTIEAYDFDAFRDGGIHWRYLQEALDDLAGEKLPDADPFAAEVLAEYVAQFGVLVLRMAGEEGIRRDEERLSVKLLESGLRNLQKSIVANGARKEDEPVPDRIESSGAGSPRGKELRFEEVTGESGVVFMQRSSDWLSRLLRSYLPKGGDAGVITIPPAFGGSGAAAEDVNGDGMIDLLLLSGAGNRLYLGRGEGRFEDVTARSGLSFRREQDRAPGEPRQPLIADFDNDGKQDVLITYVDDDHRLYRGNGDGSFVDVTAGATLGGAGLVGGPATTFDFDRDGLLDIYVSYFGDYVRGELPTLKRRNDNGLPNRLFRNLGGMRFEDVTGKAGVGDRGWGQAAMHTDFDGDGWQDLISGNDFGVNRYYRNKGDGTFEEVSTGIGTDKPSYTMSISTSDLNGDGLPDIYISNIVTMNKDEGYVLPNEDTRMKFDLAKLANLRVVEANDLFLSARTDGKLSYTLSTAVERGYSATGWAWDADFFDADLDGDDDLYVLNGMNEFNVYSSRDPYFMNADELKSKQVFIPVAAAEANVFFENSDGKLRKPGKACGLEFSGNSRSAVYLDWDGDGDLDVCVNGFGERARLFRNDAEKLGGNWITLTLAGDPAVNVNRDAIGARVTIRLPDGRTIWREVQGSTGYLSVHPKRVHAGLGAAKTVTVTVTWPNGTVQEVGEMEANRLHTIRIPAR